MARYRAHGMLHGVCKHVSTAVQDEEVITMEAPDPHSIFASETLTSRHLADTQARPTSTQHPPKEVSQGEGVPHSLFASDALARMRLAEARGVPTSTQDRPETSSQGESGQTPTPIPRSTLASMALARMHLAETRTISAFAQSVSSCTHIEQRLMPVHGHRLMLSFPA